MKRTLTTGLKLAQWFEYLDWHWIPLLGQLLMALEVLRLQGGMIPEFADEFDISLPLLRAAWFIAFLIGASVLYRFRGSVGFVTGFLPFLVYTFLDVGYNVFIINNYHNSIISGVMLGLVLKIFLRMQNGRIRHD